MALSDYVEGWQGVPFKLPETAPQAQNTLADVDSQLAEAQKAAANRGRREQILRQIQNLENQNDELKNRRAEIKKNSIADMDEDKVVAMAKAKGIKDSDIEAWLRGRAQRSTREISLGQTKAQEELEKTMKEQNKQDAIQAIYDAEADLVAAEKAVPDEELRERDAVVKSKRNKFERLKRDYEKAYGETWDAFNDKGNKTPAEVEKGPQNAQNEPQAPVVTLTEEEISVLDEPTIAKFNEPTAKNEDKREIKAKAQKKIRENNEADKVRQKKLAAIKADMATLGIKSAGDVSKVLGNFKKSPSRNDKVKVGAFNRIMEFAKNDKEYNSYPKLGELLGKK